MRVEIPINKAQCQKDVESWKKSLIPKPFRNSSSKKHVHVEVKRPVTLNILLVSIIAAAGGKASVKENKHGEWRRFLDVPHPSIRCTPVALLSAFIYPNLNQYIYTEPREIRRNPTSACRARVPRMCTFNLLRFIYVYVSNRGSRQGMPRVCILKVWVHLVDRGRNFRRENQIHRLIIFLIVWKNCC